MRNFILSGLLLLISTNLKSQEKATDMFSVNAGFWGAGINYEKRITNEFTVIGKVEYEALYYDSSHVWAFGNLHTNLTFGLEGRYYYNFDKRIKKDKKTLNNSANYVAVEIIFEPIWTKDLNDNEGISLKSKSLGIIPKYGFKRSISNHFYYEFNAGANIRNYTEEYKYYSDPEISTSKWVISPTVEFRIGYKF